MRRTLVYAAVSLGTSLTTAAPPVDLYGSLLLIRRYVPLECSILMMWPALVNYHQYGTFNNSRTAQRSNEGYSSTWWPL